MPSVKQKPSDIAVEAKRTYIPYIDQKYPQFPPQSFLHVAADALPTASVSSHDGSPGRLRVAVIDGDPVDVALDWHDYEAKAVGQGGTGGHVQCHGRIPIVNMANEKRAGGDWESGLIAPEENLCRRSNLVRCLTTPWSNATLSNPNYPIPIKGGIYSPHVVVFRSGPERGYAIWPDFKSLPVISVAPIRRPKLDESGQRYSFDQEKELMKEKIRIILRIAAAWKHRDLCVGAFGAGPGFRNPVQQLATMWRDILFSEDEFHDVFSNIVFAIESKTPDGTAKHLSEYEVFRREFDASNVFKTAYR